MRRKRLSSLDILSSKRAPRDYYKGKNCKPTGFHTRKGSILPSSDLGLAVPASPARQVIVEMLE
jgi:large subunit ribosomal protein L41